MLMRNVLAYADGKTELEGLSNKLGVPLEQIKETVDLLADHGLISL